jgi:magnesium-transporting ATPase (P-type)
LEIFPFTSDRARMSVVVLDPRDGQIKLYSKGSDQKMFKVMSRESKETIWPRTDQHLAQYGRLGLRTLCCAYRVIPREEFVEWMTKHKLAKASIADRETLVKDSEDRLEHDLTLLGATAIEDKLQDGVPETIQKLATAGIKLWMLTGDKVETAINIGRSCRLLTPKMDRKLITLQIPDKATEREGRDLCFQMLTDHFNDLKDAPEAAEDRAIVISGRCLDFIFPARKKDPRTGKDIVCAASFSSYFPSSSPSCFHTLIVNHGIGYDRPLLKQKSIKRMCIRTSLCICAHVVKQ